MAVLTKKYGTTTYTLIILSAVIVFLSVPSTASASDLTGRWNSSIGLVYDITQVGQTMSWKVTTTPQTATGTVQGNTVNASWTGPGNTGSASGKIIRDQQGRAIRIEWSNGVVFTRKLPAAPSTAGSAAFDLTGTWGSTIGHTYQIAQQGSSFTWDVAKIGQKATGQIQGNSVNASWQGPRGTGSAKGTVELDGQGRAVKIKWSNGVVFSRAVSPQTPSGSAEPQTTMPQPSIASVSLASAQISRNQPTATALATTLGIGTLEDLGLRIKDSTTLRSLSQSAGVTPNQILFLAHEMELRTAIGQPNLSNTDTELLDELGLETVSSLASFSGHEDLLHETINELAKHRNVVPPTADRVALWVSKASAFSSTLPPAVKLDRAGLTAPMVAEQMQTVETVEAQEISGVPDFMIQGYALGSFEIPPSDSELVRQFPASESGLYCAEVEFKRDGGSASLSWQIEAPTFQPAPPQTVGGQGVPSQATAFGNRPKQAAVIGKTAVITGRTELNQSTKNRIYFYLAPSVVPLNGQLTLRLTVASNQDGGGQVDDAIEQMKAGVQGDPTIRGTILVSRVEPVLLSHFDQAVTFKSAKDRRHPLRLVQTPLYQNVREKLEQPTSLVMLLSHDSERLTVEHKGKSMLGVFDHYVGGPKSSFYDQRDVLGYILRDGTPVSGYRMYDDRYTEGNFVYNDVGRGIEILEIDNLQTGVYEFLVNTNESYSPKPTFSELTTIGHVYQHWQPTESANDVRLFLKGGEKPKTVYIAELERLEVSDQPEPGDDDNDTGDGEFRISIGTVLTQRNPYAEDQGSTFETKSLSWSKSFPDYPSWLLPDPVYIRTSIGKGSGAAKHFIYPKVPIASFSVDQAADFDDLGIVVTVTEDDDVPWTAGFKAWADALEKLAKIVTSFISKNWVGLGKAYYDAYANLESVFDVEEVDDTMGFPSIVTSKEGNFGTRDGSYFTFTASGPSDPRAEQHMVVPSGDPRGSVSRPHTGYSGRWAKADVTIRKRLAPFTWSDVQLKAFTIRNDPSKVVWWAGGTGIVFSKTGTQPMGVGVVVRQGDIQYRTLYTKYGPSAFMPLPGTRYPTFYASWTDQLKMTVPLGQVQNLQVTRPPVPHKGDLVANPFTHVQIEFLQDLPGNDNPLGIVSQTIYHEDLYRAVALKQDPYDSKEAKYAAHKGGNVTVEYGRDGEFYVADYTIRDPGSWVSEVQLRAYVYIAE